MNEDSVTSELVDAENDDSVHIPTDSPAAAKRPRRNTKRCKLVESGSSRQASDSDVLFGQFVAAELRTIADPTKKLYTKMLIHNIISTAKSDH